MDEFRYCWGEMASFPLTEPVSRLRERKSGVRGEADTYPDTRCGARLARWSPPTPSGLGEPGTRDWARGGPGRAARRQQPAAIVAGPGSPPAGAARYLTMKAPSIGLWSDAIV